MRLAKTSTARVSDNRRKRGLIARLVIRLTQAGVAAVLCMLFINSGIFTLKKVLIYGNRHLGYADVVELMELRRDENLLTLRMEEVYESLHSSPWVRSVTMRKELPDTLVLKLEDLEGGLQDLEDLRNALDPAAAPLTVDGRTVTVTVPARSAVVLMSAD